MKKGKKTSEGHTQRVGLTNNPDRIKARKKAKQRHKEASKRAGFKKTVLQRHKAVDEYFKYREKIGSEIIKYTREYHAENGARCPWCDNFEKNDFKHCLHCGRIFVASEPV